MLLSKWTAVSKNPGLPEAGNDHQKQHASIHVTCALTRILAILAKF